MGKENTVHQQFSEMSSFWVVSGVLCVVLSVIYADSDDFGNGIWEPISIEKCEEPEHKFKYDLQLVKHNSTHGGLQGHFISEETFTKDFGIRLVLHKCEGGECKQMQMLQENCLIDFLNKYVEEEVKDMMIACGMDPPEVPIEKGVYDIDDYVFAKKQGIGVYGTFLLKSYVMEEDKEVGCIGFTIEFKKCEV